jgi:hypothetical protein
MTAKITDGTKNGAELRQRIKELRESARRARYKRQRPCSGQYLIALIYYKNLPEFIRVLELGVDVNFQDEEGMTALHHAASLSARPWLRHLVKSNRCDYLIQDNEGRYASDLAIGWARDYAVGRLLRIHQVRQAWERGVPAWEKRKNKTA